MQHWYGYHSEKTMGQPYSAVAGSRFYVKKNFKQLTEGDWIWLVEGDVRAPRRFTLVDCFEVDEIDRGPFSGSFAPFAAKAIGHASRLRFPVGLNRADVWFAELHGEFITKQKLFSRLTERPHIIASLKQSSGMQT